MRVTEYGTGMSPWYASVQYTMGRYLLGYLSTPEVCFITVTRIYYFGVLLSLWYDFTILVLGYDFGMVDHYGVT